MRLAAIATVGLVMMLSSCGTVGLFGEYDVPESPETAEAPWPRLVDVPGAPPVGAYSAAVPDPARGVALQVELNAAAAEQNAAARVLDEPVLSDADRRKLGR
ncbi:MAG: hypothetical protein AAFY66_08355 [Pseudomonadota bacterium]